MAGEISFENRQSAGRALAEALAAYRDQYPLVMALPRGGVPVAYEVARALSAPLGLVFVRKIGAPGQPELAAGAVADGNTPETVVNESVQRAFGLDHRFFEQAAEIELKEIEARREKYLRGRPQPKIEDKTAIVIDDGVATGATTLAALRSVRRAKPRKLVLAVPLAPSDALAAMRAEVDALVCLKTPEPFVAIGNHYREFAQLSDEEVQALIDRAQAFGGAD